MTKAGTEQAKEQAPSGSSLSWSQAQALEHLETHTESFAGAVIQCLEDFFGIEARQKGVCSIQKGYLAFGDVHVSVPFSGVVNGEYVINLDEVVAAQLMDQELDPEADEEDKVELREELGAAMCELLNTAVGLVIGELSHKFPHLSFASPRISYGQRVYPLLRFGLVDLETDCGELRCHFYVDHMELDLTTSYLRIKKEVARVRQALRAHMELVDRILTATSTAVFWVKPDGNLFHRHSQACARVLGTAPSSSDSPTLAELVTSHLNSAQIVPELEQWLSTAFQSTGPQTWDNDVLPACPLLDSNDKETGEPLAWRWLPVYQAGRPTVAALLVAVDRCGQASPQRCDPTSWNLIDQLAHSEWSMLDTGSLPTSGLLAMGSSQE